MQEEFSRTVLFPLLKAGLALTDTLPTLTDEDAAQLLRFGKRQSILPIMTFALQRCGADPDLTERFRLSSETDLLRYLFMEQALAEISTAFDAAKLPYLPLKGAVMRALYPEPWLRTSSDIDVLVHAEDLDRAVTVLEEKTGFAAGKRSDHDISLMSPQVHLELHFRLYSGETDAQNAMLDTVWSHAQREGEGSRYAMDPAFQVFYHLSHMSRHFRRQGMGIRPVTDLFLMRQRLGEAEETLREMCGRCGLLRFYEAASLLGDVWFAEETHTPLTKELEALCLSGGVFGSAESAVMASRYESGHGLAYIFHRAFLPRSRLEEYYPELKEQPRRLAVYQIKRWFRASTKERGRILQGMKMAKRHETETERFEKLMRSLDL